MQIGNGSNSEQTARAAPLLLDISATHRDKPSTTAPGALGHSYLAPAPTAAGKLLFDIVNAYPSGER
ncbi:hypothetical protein KCP69_14390 [Salmonella enterica subsp. enterica]|nr:hypothetical protein KCP69_14390 [Salmonella enterica subsp. enterica]